MKPFRTRFGKDIVAEFLPPLKPSKKAIIFLSGMPSVPKLSDVLNFYSRKGFWVFHPRYRGSWESRGSFLEKSPEKDVLDIINQLPKGFTNLASSKKYKLNIEKLYLFASSFGGPAAILASTDKRITKAITLSPVIDWSVESKAEPLDWLLGYIREAYGKAYNISDKNWKKLKSGNFYNPIKQAEKIDGRKLLIFQAKDDDVVDWQPAFKFAKINNSTLTLLRRGGHLSSTLFSTPFFYKEIKKFLGK